MRNAKLGDNGITQHEKFSTYCLDTTLVLPSGSCPCQLTNLPLKKKKNHPFIPWCSLEAAAQLGAVF